MVVAFCSLETAKTRSFGSIWGWFYLNLDIYIRWAQCQYRCLKWRPAILWAKCYFELGTGSDGGCSVAALFATSGAGFEADSDWLGCDSKAFASGAGSVGSADASAGGHAVSGCADAGAECGAVGVSNACCGWSPCLSGAGASMSAGACEGADSIKYCAHESSAQAPGSWLVLAAGETGKCFIGCSIRLGCCDGKGISFDFGDWSPSDWFDGVAQFKSSTACSSITAASSAGSTA